MSEGRFFYERKGEDYDPISPIVPIENIIDKDNRQSLIDILRRINHIYVSFQGNEKMARLAVPKELRRKGLVISYLRGIDEELICEQFIGNPSFTGDDDWVNSENWAAILNTDNICDFWMPNGWLTPEKLNYEKFYEYVKNIVEDINSKNETKE